MLAIALHHPAAAVDIPRRSVKDRGRHVACEIARRGPAGRADEHADLIQQQSEATRAEVRADSGAGEQPGRSVNAGCLRPARIVRRDEFGDLRGQRRQQQRLLSKSKVGAIFVRVMPSVVRQPMRERIRG